MEDHRMPEDPQPWPSKECPIKTFLIFIPLDFSLADSTTGKIKRLVIKLKEKREKIKEDGQVDTKQGTKNKLNREK